MMDTEKAQNEVEQALFKYWKTLPKPKIWFGDWYRQPGGFRDLLMNDGMPKGVEQHRELKGGGGG
jgi:hypothetical protein